MSKKSRAQRKKEKEREREKQTIEKGKVLQQSSVSRNAPKNQRKAPAKQKIPQGFAVSAPAVRAGKPYEEEEYFPFRDNIHETLTSLGLPYADLPEEKNGVTYYTEAFNHRANPFIRVRAFKQGENYEKARVKGYMTWYPGPPYIAIYVQQKPGSGHMKKLRPQEEFPENLCTTVQAATLLLLKELQKTL